MSRNLTKDKVKENSSRALMSLNTLLDKYIEQDELKKADLISYWLKDYANFLDNESDFNPRALRRYKRGEIIKVHLGYNIGSEEGGLHYCVILDNKNLLSSGIITVVPLTSAKPEKDLNNLRYGEVYLGSDLKNKLEEKLTNISSDFYTNLEKLSLEGSGDNLTKAKEILDTYTMLEKIKSELLHMNNGSIALVSQITTISKLRIYTPKTNYDALANIKLSNKSLDEIDKKLKELYTYQKK